MDLASVQAHSKWKAAAIIEKYVCEERDGEISCTFILFYVF